ncbi:5411_t:CDS:2 [Racocetra persica]|uniref:5411_t:CDS:1 n=1 Tax=Racocetra persica TaxID=160502 RepID=A0ACA9M687_9GLOM|nr:5411_t:CDS:2 [Racocetra persica]
MEFTKTYLIGTCYLYTQCLYCNKEPSHKSLNVSTSYNTSSYDIINPNYEVPIHKYETSKFQETSPLSSDTSIDNSVSTSYENNSYDNYNEKPILYDLFENNFHISKDKDHEYISEFIVKLYIKDQYRTILPAK